MWGKKKRFNVQDFKCQAAEVRRKHEQLSVRSFPFPVQMSNGYIQASANPRAAAATVVMPTRVFLRLDMAAFLVSEPPVVLG